jgi:hypothetical protein
MERNLMDKWRERKKNNIKKKKILRELITKTMRL